MKIGFESIVHYMPAEILDVKERYAYLEPAIRELPAATQEKLRAEAPRQVRRLKDPSAAEAPVTGGVNPMRMSSATAAPTNATPIRDKRITEEMRFRFVIPSSFLSPIHTSE